MVTVGIRRAIEQFRHASGVRNVRKKLGVPWERPFCVSVWPLWNPRAPALRTLRGLFAPLMVVRNELFDGIRTLRPDITGPTSCAESEITPNVMLTERDITSLSSAFMARTFASFLVRRATLACPTRQ